MGSRGVSAASASSAANGSDNRSVESVVVHSENRECSRTLRKHTFGAAGA